MFGKKQVDTIPKEPDFEIFVAYDSKTGIYDSPVFAANQHDIVRSTINMFKTSKPDQSKYVANPEDFQIFKVGSYCKKTGIINSTTPQHIANLHELATLAKRDLGIVST